MADEEERVLENLLELQLQEQRESLSTINDALASEPNNTELLALHEEIVQAIKDAEEGLLNLKRARLLREADLVLDGLAHVDEGVKVETIDLTETDVEPEPLEDPSYPVGSKCRFRHTDGRWYNGQVIGLEGSDSAKISFLTPTSENMMICKFFLQQRCRFGTNCRLSHGVDVPLSSLRKYIPTIWEQSLVGSSIWAVSDSKTGVWREAELESWDGALGVGKVVFRDDGSSADLGEDAITLSEYAQMSGEEESDSSSDQSDSSDYDDETPQGLGFLESTILQRGIQTETAIFAKWENHTRGIASRMMANMGYLEGTGLGASGQGIIDPISVKVLPPKQSLDHAVKTREGEERKESKENQGKKRSRGGKRKREKKFAALARAAKEEEESTPDVFSLINSQLAKHGEALNGKSAKKQQSNGSGEGKKVDRRALVAYDDEVKDLKARVGKLEEMAIRNKNEKVVYDAAMRKLTETRKALAQAEAAQASASNAVVSKEKEKRWLKF
ncbi:LOW QUALITY PROTEIN: zinc finger CCCH domain-containing protein 22 [Pyrus x bretschneideri]|uniref:LOW QUALITY PROTEIN: zinc finger CCCH domain-containing protein 22 n=1 Tax=Pyrus x bretschneideri TaxID=225117 RepID=UPI00202F7F00|nr:LOW QUALITY PROTEIN: zinc finger CCCH domain-containing protein 22 [Pyrus x bretschneideri]